MLFCLEDFASHRTDFFNGLYFLSKICWYIRILVKSHWTFWPTKMKTTTLSWNVRHQTPTDATTYHTDLKAIYTKAVCLRVCTGNQKILLGKFLLFKVRVCSLESHGWVTKQHTYDFSTCCDIWGSHNGCYGHYVRIGRGRECYLRPRQPSPRGDHVGSKINTLSEKNTFYAKRFKLWK